MIILIQESLLGYAQILNEFKHREERFNDALYHGRPPLNRYEQNYATIKTSNIKYMPEIGARDRLRKYLNGADQSDITSVYSKA